MAAVGRIFRFNISSKFYPHISTFNRTICRSSTIGAYNCLLQHKKQLSSAFQSAKTTLIPSNFALNTVSDVSS
jgi:hypothetical protein